VHELFDRTAGRRHECSGNMVKRGVLLAIPRTGSACRLPGQSPSRTSNCGSLNWPPLLGTLVPVEEPSTASKAYGNDQEADAHPCDRGESPEW
jgi:hypothetical protein